MAMSILDRCLIAHGMELVPCIIEMGQNMKVSGGLTRSMDEARLIQGSVKATWTPGITTYICAVRLATNDFKNGRRERR